MKPKQVLIYEDINVDSNWYCRHKLISEFVECFNNGDLGKRQNNWQDALYYYVTEKYDHTTTKKELLSVIDEIDSYSLLAKL